jgi:hypothetical protein
MRKTVEQRFMEKVDKSGKCWIWLAAKAGGKHSDYGVFSLHGRQCYAHRVAYELFRKPIPKDLQIDHLCRKRDCVNPAHLRAVTQQENLISGEGSTAINFRKTHCKRGHEFTPENTNTMTRWRRCQKCIDAYARAYVQKHKPARRKINT